jgi:hypothetical protein
MTSATIRVFQAAVMIAAVFGAPLRAQHGEQPGIVVPLRAVVTPAADGESLELSGTLAVASQISIEADGTKVLSYTFTSAGTARGVTSRDTYDISGQGVERFALDVELPADRGFTASFTATGKDKSHRFSVVVHASLDIDDTLTAAVVTAIDSKR